MFTIKESEFLEWQTYIEKCQKINILQYWQYGAAKERSSNWKVIRFIISDDEGKVVAISQFLTRTFPIIGGIARMNRGPLLLRNLDLDHEQAENIALNVVKALLKEAKSRRWWLIQIAPEILDGEGARKYLESIGLKKIPITPSASGLLSLESNEDALMKSLKGKWRNCLRKGLKLGVSITKKEGTSEELVTLLKSYHNLQNDKGFSGLSDDLITALAQQEGENWQFTLYIANDELNQNINESIGMLVGIRHGDTVTYMIGYTNDVGRKLQANNVLLWSAILHSKEIGCKWFDIGGLNASTPQGIAHFKQGVNSELYSLIGEWRGLTLPWIGNVK